MLASFPRTKRLLEASAFQAVFKTATIRLTSTTLMLLAKPNDHHGPRLGLAISKRHIKLACKRNRLKRVIRASFSQQSLPALDIVILNRGQVSVDNKEHLWQQLQQLWNKCIARSSG